MKNKFNKFFLWIKDHFSFLFVVLLRLYVGKKKKENPNQKGSNPDVEDRQNGERL